MLAEDYSVQFDGFEPSSETRSAIDIVLRQLYLRAPSRSFLKATFTRTGDIFEGVINITSRAGEFVVEATDKQLKLVGEKLIDGLGSQLEKWRAIRF